MKFIFFIIALLIVYGSLFPFSISFGSVPESSLQTLFDFDIRKTIFSDLVANIILFIPFGMFIKAAFPSNRPTISILNFLLFGFVFAFSIQVMQLWTSNRLPWGGDAIWNTIGCAIGLIIHSSIRLNAFKRLHGLHAHKQISFALAIALILINLAPFAPTMDIGLLKDNIKAIVQNPSIDIYKTFELTSLWLAAFYLLWRANPQWSRFRLLVVVVCSVIAFKFIIISSNINLSHMFAGGFALIIWRFVPIRKASILAGLLLLAIIANGLYPFALNATTENFNWLPFTGVIRGNLLVNIITTCKKLVIYGSCIWLLYLSTKQMVMATLVCASVLLLSEFLQTMFTNSIAESTDSLIAIIIALIFSQKLKYSHASVSETSPDERIGDKGVLLSTKAINVDNKTASQTVDTQLENPSFSHVKTINEQSYIGGLDGLRAVAALAVFFVHFQQFSQFKGSIGFIDFERLMVNGNTGVCLFFVLSGFLLSVPFWREINQGTFPKIRDYMINRIVRIMPIYYCCLLGIMILNGFQSSDINVDNIVSHLLFLHNLKDVQVMSLNPPFWTLAVEFQFYLVLPLVFLLFAKIGAKSAQVLAILLVPATYIGYRLFMQYLENYQDWPIEIPLLGPIGTSVASVEGPALTYSLVAHLPHFFIGIVAASFYKNTFTYNAQKTKLAETVFWISAISVLLILATPMADNLQIAYGRYHFPFVPILLGLIVFSTPFTRFAKSILEWAPIKWLGIISYSLYIFHWPIQQASFQTLIAFDLSAKDNVFLFAGMSFVITVIVSHFSYLIIEAPILRRFKQRKKNSKNVGTVSAIDNKTA